MPNDTLTVNPTPQEEMAKFQGFSSTDGKPDAPPAAEGTAKPNTGAAAPKTGEAAKTETKTAAAAAPAKVALTDEEGDAALEAARGKLAEGEELTKEEEDEILAAALETKRSATKPATSNDRVKRAQDGRRRAEARAAKAESALSAMERRLAALEKGEKPAGGAPLTAAAKGGKDALTEPNPNDFEAGELDPKYIAALARFSALSATQEEAGRQQTETQRRRNAEAAAEFAEKKGAFEEAGLSAIDDFQEVVIDTVGLPETDPAAWPLSDTMGELLLDSEFGPQIAYQLASDPKEARKVFALSLARQAAWFGKQEAKFSADPAANNGKKPADEGDDETGGTGDEGQNQQRQQPKVSSAPAPVKRAQGAGGNRQVGGDTTDFAAFEAVATANARPRR